MTDLFSKKVTELNSPARSAFAVTPSDTVDLPFVSRALYIGTGGSNFNLNVLLEKDSVPVLLKNIPSGTHLYIRAKRVYSTDTTVTDIVALI